MYDIIIKENNDLTLIKIINGKFCGCKIANHKICPLNEECINVLKLLCLSENKTDLGFEDGYQIYLDNNTNLKHYFKNGKEDISKFILMNSKNAVSYLDDEKVDYDKKLLEIKVADRIRFVFILGAMAFALGNLNNDQVLYADSFSENYEYENYEVTEVTKEDLANYILNNSNLTEEDKALFLNEKLFKDITPYYNNTAMDYLIHKKLKNMKIDYYLDSEEEVKGYYYTSDLNTIHIRKDITDPEKLKKVKVHEFLHLLESPNSYYYLDEACNEIIGEEYFNMEINAYQEKVYNIKTLMEIVGPVPIWELKFSGDDEFLKMSIENYLKNEEAKRLLELLQTNQHNATEASKINDEIRELLGTMYQNKYGIKIEDDHVITAIRGNIYDPIQGLERAYFNSDLINKNDDSYLVALKNVTLIKDINYDEYLEFINSSDEDISLEYTIKNGYSLIDGEVYINGEPYPLLNCVKAGLVSVRLLKVRVDIDELDYSKYRDWEFKVYKTSSPSTVFKEVRIPNIYDKFPEQKINSLDEEVVNLNKF